eukprot:XP_027304613.1 uncharacterized protein LOC113842131 [Anas platyrhynchos]
MEARSAPILCNGRLMCPTLMHLQDDEIVKVWDAVSHFIRRQFALNKGVTVPGLGTFFAVKQDRPMAGVKLLDAKKPVFQVSEHFANVHGLPYKKETFPGKKRDDCLGSHARGLWAACSAAAGRAVEGFHSSSRRSRERPELLSSQGPSMPCTSLQTPAPRNVPPHPVGTLMAALVVDFCSKQFGQQQVQADTGHQLLWHQRCPTTVLPQALGALSFRDSLPPDEQSARQLCSSAGGPRSYPTGTALLCRPVLVIFSLLPLPQEYLHLFS